MVEGLFKNGLNQTRGKMQDVSSNSKGGEIIFEVAFIVLFIPYFRLLIFGILVTLVA